MIQIPAILREIASFGGSLYEKRPPPTAVLHMHLAAVADRSGIQIPFDLLKKAALYTPVADYLFDFHSQGLITVRSFTASSPWMSVGSCFLNCSDVF